MYRALNILATESEQSACGFWHPKLDHSTSPFATMLNPASCQHAHQMALYGHQLQHPTFSTREQQRYYPSQSFVFQAAQHRVEARLRLPHEQTEPSCARRNQYTYNLIPSGYSTADMRFSSQQVPIGYDASGGHADLGKLRRNRVARVLR